MNLLEGEESMKYYRTFIILRKQLQFSASSRRSSISKASTQDVRPHGCYKWLPPQDYPYLACSIKSSNLDNKITEMYPLYVIKSLVYQL